MLGEIHVALLKSIIKDIEDVARTPTGIGIGQYCAANPEGGHPRIIEGVTCLYLANMRSVLSFTILGTCFDVFTCVLGIFMGL